MEILPKPHINMFYIIFIFFWVVAYFIFCFVKYSLHTVNKIKRGSDV